eukprot:CAMPEP_0197858956 /NCGR_PEP_ID=MMETSP1438-20131217/33147_1 /TAXON_ID=1461541 /ORGANISM="Pterosperma sp., Strain CCMP1384" /LENGTH=461 /DNA_ID=CAMNT_0043475281 /DNA_START=400 /DNA_END=1786 /DNA_ORIENTATION=+
MTQGNLATWLMKEGDKVNAGDILADVETDKATMGFDSQEDGYLAKCLIPAGAQDVQVGTLVAILVEEEEDVAAFANYTASAAPASASAAAPPTAASPPNASAVPDVDIDDLKMGPAARFLMHNKHFSPSQITATGPHGMILKEDVLAAIEAGVKGTAPVAATPKAAPVAATQAPPAKAAAPAAVAASEPTPATNRRRGEPHTDEEASTMRKIIASKLLASKANVPHTYVSMDVDLDPVMAMRSELKDAGTKVSVNDCVIKAAAIALSKVPEANAFWNEATGEIEANPNVDISMAVATDKGLITPIIFGADSLSVVEVGVASKTVATKARENKLKPEEFIGGSFSISNLGMFPVDNFRAIINAPQACIMAVGRGVKKVVLVNGKPATKMAMTVTLSADSRVYTPELAARYLEAFKESFEGPSRMLIEAVEVQIHAADYATDNKRLYIMQEQVSHMPLTCVGI